MMKWGSLDTSGPRRFGSLRSRRSLFVLPRPAAFPKRFLDSGFACPTPWWLPALPGGLRALWVRLRARARVRYGGHGGHGGHDSTTATRFLPHHSHVDRRTAPQLDNQLY